MIDMSIICICAACNWNKTTNKEQVHAEKHMRNLTMSNYSNIPNHGLRVVDIIVASDSGAHAKAPTLAANLTKIRNASAKTSPEDGMDKVGVAAGPRVVVVRAKCVDLSVQSSSGARDRVVATHDVDADDGKVGVDLLLVDDVHASEEVFDVLGHSVDATLLVDEILVDLDQDANLVRVLVPGVVGVVRFELAVIGRALVGKSAGTTKFEAFHLKSLAKIKISPIITMVVMVVAAAIKENSCTYRERQ